MDKEKILIAVISSLAGGFIKYLFDCLMNRKKDKKDKIEKLEMQRRERPEFVITDMKDYFNRPGICINSNPCDLEVFVAKIKNVDIREQIVFAEYEDFIRDKKSWVCRRYTLKNVGKTVAYGVDIISNFKKTTCIFDVNNMDSTIKHGLLSYSELLDKRIAPDESFTLKICYHKESVLSGMFSAPLSIGIRDDNIIIGNRLFLLQVINFTKV